MASIIESKRIKTLTPRSLPAALRIERDAYDFPWSEQDFHEYLTHRQSTGLMLFERAIAIGFAIYEFHLGHLQIVNIAVDPYYHRKGYGTDLLRLIAANARRADVPKCRLLIRETNLGGQLFFAKNGYRATAVLRAEYPDTGESAYVMEKEVK